MELKSSLDPTNKVLKSWTSNSDPCAGSFEGVACNNDLKVVNISLQGKGLSGTISPAIAGLNSLSGLYLHYNSLSGEIPKEISNLPELSDLYLDVNNFSGSIPPEISNMAGLQVLQLCCNRLTGNIPSKIGSLKKLTVLALQHNELTGEIPGSLGDLTMLRRLDLSFNEFYGTIPAKLADNPGLETLDVRNNTLSGILPSGLERLNGGFRFENNPGLCGTNFPGLRACTVFDNVNTNQVGPIGTEIENATKSAIKPKAPPNYSSKCNNCSNQSKFRLFPVIIGVVTLGIVMIGALFLAFCSYRRRKKQKIGSTDSYEGSVISTEHAKEFHRNGSISPLVTIQYSHGWDPLGEGLSGIGFSQEHLNSFRFNIEEVESATQSFSKANLLGRSKFSSVHRGVLRDGSVVAVRSINVSSCKLEESEFVKGLNLLTSLKHENVVRLRGFCCSRDRGECFLIYDFASNGNLSKYFENGDGDDNADVLDWFKRINIINGIAKGIEYLHSSQANKPSIVHRNISVEKVLLDRQFNPLIADSGLHKLLADDIMFSTLKVSAAMGYLAPEYVTTGRFTEKTDIFAFGVIILQILSGKLLLPSAIRSPAASGRFEDFIDVNLRGKFSEAVAAKLGKLALECTDELPEERPAIQTIIQELNHCSSKP